MKHPTIITRSVAAVGLLLLSVGSTAAQAPANITAAGSHIIATFKQEGVPVDSPFTKFTGRIVYDAKNVAGASATLEVDTGSLDIGDEGYNAEVRKKQWFDSATYPKATFRSTSIKPLGANRFEATGPLTFKGLVLTITVPVTVSSTPSGTAFDGAFVVHRQSFKIGDPIWGDVIDDKVDVRFRLISSGK